MKKKLILMEDNSILPIYYYNIPLYKIGQLFNYMTIDRLGYPIPKTSKIKSFIKITSKLTKIT